MRYAISMLALLSIFPVKTSVIVAAPFILGRAGLGLSSEQRQNSA